MRKDTKLIILKPDDYFCALMATTTVKGREYKNDAYLMKKFMVGYCEYEKRFNKARCDTLLQTIRGRNKAYGRIAKRYREIKNENNSMAAQLAQLDSTLHDAEIASAAATMQLMAARSRISRMRPMIGYNRLRRYKIVRRIPRRQRIPRNNNLVVAIRYDPYPYVKICRTEEGIIAREEELKCGTRYDLRTVCEIEDVQPIAFHNQVRIKMEDRMVIKPNEPSMFKLRNDTNDQYLIRIVNEVKEQESSIANI